MTIIKRFIRKLYAWAMRPEYQFGAIGDNGFIGEGSWLHNENCMFIGNEYRIGNNASMSCYTEYGGTKLKPHLKIGDRFLAGQYLKILCAGNIVIGNDVTFGGNVFISDENHGLSPLTPNYLDNDLMVKNVTIGDGVWIGEGVKILPGVNIGKKTVIGAGSVVTNDIPAYTIAVGNPCRVIKKWAGDKWENI